MSMKNEKYAANICKLKTLDANIQNLINMAVETRLNSYSPYSNFKVGASVLCDDGKIFSGCNVENNAFTVGLCAERCAYGKAISEGNMKFKAVAVVAQQENSFTTPCGACRQFMNEFGNVDVYITKPNCNDVLVLNMDQLLPFKFETVGNTFI
ncbi:cytidine deaminase-like [Diorhabda carinulata]|uniref:cytidine deaminase-like n=1 Tax=Diorhabda sublineata TaxID=1163346 RepID=UPI0024E16B5B|nr:cytidine deaminase-like [Diorhabda sublineata]XP_057672510.1 cytidine deaminase-like [Diorhabda carinulata]